MANEVMGMPALCGAPVPDVFADEAVMFDVVNGTLRITVAVATPTEPAPLSPMALANIGRLIIPVQSTQRQSLALYDYLKKHDLDPAHLVSGGQQAN